MLESIRRGADLSRQRRTARAERVELERRRYQLLTAREREVFALITTGLLNKQAAAELGTAERTIKTHRGRMTRKMGAESVAALVRMAATLEIHALASKRRIADPD
jgi:FixJ family two-component response regulator